MTYHIPKATESQKRKLYRQQSETALVTRGLIRRELYIEEYEVHSLREGQDEKTLKNIQEENIFGYDHIVDKEEQEEQEENSKYRMEIPTDEPPFLEPSTVRQESSTPERPNALEEYLKDIEETKQSYIVGEITEEFYLSRYDIEELLSVDYELENSENGNRRILRLTGYEGWYIYEEIKKGKWINHPANLKLLKSYFGEEEGKKYYYATIPKQQRHLEVDSFTDNRYGGRREYIPLDADSRDYYYNMLARYHHYELGMETYDNDEVKKIIGEKGYNVLKAIKVGLEKTENYTREYNNVKRRENIGERDKFD